MKILDSHEYIEMYRGDKDLRIGKILVERFGCEYVVLAPAIASPADDRILKTTDFPIRYVETLPSGFKLKTLWARTFFFNRDNISLGGFFQITPKYIFEIRNESPDIIFENAYTTLTPRMYMSYFAGRLLDIPIVYLDPGDIPPKGFFKQSLNILERRVVKNAAKIITYNELGKNRFMREYGVDSEDIVVIPKPVDTKKFDPKISGDNFRKKNGIEDKFVVGYYGRLDRNKGSEHLIHAAKKIHEMGLNDIVFMFVGGNIIDSDAKFIKDLVQKLDLDNLHFTGMLTHNEMSQAYAAADMVVFPDVTNLPGFSTVLAESMAMGKPIVIGIKGFENATPLKHMESGVIIDPSSPEEISESILLLKNDRDLRLRLSYNVRSYAKANMDWHIITEKYYKIFKEVLNGRYK
jgi:glycosyltransferase involved in cell wall biosynthesis